MLDNQNTVQQLINEVNLLRTQLDDITNSVSVMVGSDALASEIIHRTNADAALDGRINQEISDRTNADAALDGRINQEISDRTNADAALDGGINQEISDRTNADNALTDELDAVRERLIANGIGVDLLATNNATGLDFNDDQFKVAGVWYFGHAINTSKENTAGIITVKTAGVKIYQNITFDDGTLSNRVFDGISWSLWRDIKGLFPVNVPPNASSVPAGITDLDDLWVAGVYLLWRNEIEHIPASIGITTTYVLTVIGDDNYPNANDKIQLITALDSGMSIGRIRQHVGTSNSWGWGFVSQVPYSIEGSSQTPPLIGNTYVEIFVGKDFSSHPTYLEFKLTDKITSQVLVFDTLDPKIAAGAVAPTGIVISIMLYVGRTQMPDGSFEYDYNIFNVVADDFTATHSKKPRVSPLVVGKTIDLNTRPYDINSSLFYVYEQRSYINGNIGWYSLFFILDDRFIFNFPPAYAPDIGKPCLFTSAVYKYHSYDPKEANTIDGKIVIIDTIHQLMGPPKKMYRIWKSASDVAIERDELLLDWTFFAQ